MALVMAIVLAFVVPKVKAKEKIDGDNKTKTLTFSSLVQVHKPFKLQFVSLTVKHIQREPLNRISKQRSQLLLIKIMLMFFKFGQTQNGFMKQFLQYMN